LALSLPKIGFFYAESVFFMQYRRIFKTSVEKVFNQERRGTTKMTGATSMIGVTALINMILSLFFIGISWWALQMFKFDLFIKNVNSVQAKFLQIILSIVLGHGVAQFFMDYMQWTTFLKYIF
jgi:uncharacterized integral membrane protein (TIGR02327 family)